MKQVCLIKRSLFFFFCTVLMMGSAYAQHTVQGVVTDAKGLTVVGASVIEKGTANGAMTNDKGLYRLSNVKDTATLVISFVGYIPAEVKYNGQAQLNVVLNDDTKMLQDVVVIGYGQVKKGDATGALTNVKVDDVTKGFANNAQDILTGKVAGVTITSEGGDPKSPSFIRIRGGSSLTASNDPLFIVDGVFIDNKGMNGTGNILATINPADIESFTVLKDASATAIYGSRASNGVIIITTKKGKAGKIGVSYAGHTSVSTPKNKIDVLTGDEFRVFLKDTYGSLSIYDQMKERQGLVNTDWQDVIFRTTLNTDNNLSVYGSVAQKHPFRISVGYTNVGGILKTSESDRRTASFSFAPSFFNDDLKINLNGRGLMVKNRYADWGAIGAAVAMDPSQSVYDETSSYGGFFTWTGQDKNIIQVATKNPLSILEMVNDNAKVRNFIGSAQFDYRLPFLRDLHFNLNLGMDYSRGKGTKYISEFAPSDYIYGGYDSRWNEDKRNSTVDFYAQYNKNLGFLDSHIDVMGGYSWQHYWRGGDNEGFRLTKFDAYGDPVLVNRSNFATENYIISYFGRLNYSVKNKYLFTFTIRNDGSSRFHKDNRWALFPSAALAWKVSEEDFIKNKQVVSNLKLRLSWGITGQQEINQGDYPYIATYLQALGDQANYLRGYQNGVPIWVSLLRPEAYNPNLKWESTTTYNIGIDYGFLNNRIEGSIDVYHRKTKDLINAETKTTSGTNFKEYVAANIGNLENTGAEFAISARAVQTKDFTWQIGTNFAYNRNRITKLTAGDDKDTKRRVGMTVHMVGQAANMFYVYEQVYNADGKPIEGFYKDQNNDGQINELDLRPFYKAAPDVTVGFTNKFIWKAWDFAVTGHGSIGNYNYNAVAAGNAGLSPTTIYATESLTNRVRSAFDTNFQIGQPLSDYYVQNASFFRIDNINLGWSFKKSKKFPFDGRVYSTVQNPFVFTKYKGLDPEVFGGIDGTLFPRPLTVLLGLNVNF